MKILSDFSYRNRRRIARIAAVTTLASVLLLARPAYCGLDSSITLHVYYDDHTENPNPPAISSGQSDTDYWGTIGDGIQHYFDGDANNGAKAYADIKEMWNRLDKETTKYAGSTADYQEIDIDNVNQVDLVFHSHAGDNPVGRCEAALPDNPAFSKDPQVKRWGDHDGKGDAQLVVHVKCKGYAARAAIVSGTYLVSFFTKEDECGNFGAVFGSVCLSHAHLVKVVLKSSLEDELTRVLGKPKRDEYCRYITRLQALNSFHRSSDQNEMDDLQDKINKILVGDTGLGQVLGSALAGPATPTPTPNPWAIVPGLVAGGTPTPTPGGQIHPASSGVNIAGRWTSNVGYTYNITQNGTDFNWSEVTTGQRATGSISGETISATWGQGAGTSGTARVTRRDSAGGVYQLTWNNGVIFDRARGPQPNPPLVSPVGGSSGALDVGGRWTSNIGLVYRINQNGNNFDWSEETTGQRATGIINGDTVSANWGQGPGTSGTARVTRNRRGRAVRMEWDNGVVFERAGRGRDQGQ